MKLSISKNIYEVLSDELKEKIDSSVEKKWVINDRIIEPIHRTDIKAISMVINSLMNKIPIKEKEWLTTPKMSLHLDVSISDTIFLITLIFNGEAEGRLFIEYKRKNLSTMRRKKIRELIDMWVASKSRRYTVKLKENIYV